MMDFKLAVRTFFVNLVISLAIVLTIYGVSELSTNGAIQWLIGIITVAIYLVVIWVFFTTTGKKDYTADTIRRKRIESGAKSADSEKFDSRKGFITAAVSHIPIVLINILCFVPGKFAGTMDNIMRIWYSQYNMLYKSFSGNVAWMYFFFTAIFIVFSGFAYINGKKQYERIRMIMQRNSQRKNPGGAVK